MKTSRDPLCYGSAPARGMRARRYLMRGVLGMCIALLLVACASRRAQEADLGGETTPPPVASTPTLPSENTTNEASPTVVPVDAQNDETTGDADPTVTVVQFWTTDTEPQRLETYQNVALRYMAANPTVVIQIVGVEEDQIVSRIRQAAQSDSLPDLARVGAERMVILAAEGLVDGNAAQAVIDRIGADDFRSRLLTMVADPESQAVLAVPYDGWLQALWYRRDLFQELGLETPVTWDALDRACDALAASGAVEHALTLPTARDQTYVHQVFEQFAMSNDVWPFDSNGQLALDTSAMVEVLRFYADLARCAPPGAQNLFDARERYERGRTSALFYSTYIMDDLVEGSDTRDGLDKIEIAVEDLAQRTAFAASLSGPAGVASYGQLTTLALLPGAAPVAQDVAVYFLREGYQEILALSPWGKVPVLESAMEEWSSSNPIFAYYSPATLGHIANSYEAMQRWIWRPEYTARQRALIGAIEAELLIPQVIDAMVVRQHMTPEEGAAWLQAQAEMLAP